MSSDQLYLVDTSVLVNIKDLQGDSEETWALVRAEVIAGRLKTVRQVYEELGQRWPEIQARFKDIRTDFLVPDADTYDLSVIAEVRAIHQNHPGLYDALGTGNPADPILIAVAKTISAIVVTDEKREGSGHRSRIPWVCTSRNVGSANRIEYLEVIQP